MKNIRDPGSPRGGGFWPWESLLSRILSASSREPWLEPLTFPRGSTLEFFEFFHFFDFFDFFRKSKKTKKNKKLKIVFEFFEFFRKGKKTKTRKKLKNMKKNPGSRVSPPGGFLAVGIPPLPDPGCLQPGALDLPRGSTLEFFFPSCLIQDIIRSFQIDPVLLTHPPPFREIPLKGALRGFKGGFKPSFVKGAGPILLSVPI